ncbi:hypothetical protein C8R47DRAFT_1074737 [Mycena vitilis]|nr:hypothetical protein C8R47DRAFT_1074737 [Mycena vitilis]
MSLGFGVPIRIDIISINSASTLPALHTKNFLQNVLLLPEMPETPAISEAWQRSCASTLKITATQIPECHGLHLQSVLESEFDSMSDCFVERASRPKKKIQHAGRMDSASETKTSS